MFHEYDVVKLRRQIPSIKLPLGVKGAVLIVYDEQHLPRAYEVEFVDDEGNTLAVLTVQEDDIEKA